MAAHRLFSRRFMLIIVGLLLPDCLAYCVFFYYYYIFRFAKSESLSAKYTSK